MDIRRLKNSFVYAMRGIGELWRREQNFRIEVVIGFLVMVAAYILHLRTIEKSILMLVVLLVLGSEAVNTVMENILDGTSKKINPYFRVAKDVMAGITLVTAIGAVVIGFILFYPYIKICLR